MTAAFALLAAAGSTSQAGLLEFDAQIQAGGMGGTKLNGDPEAFHDRATGFTYGALVGVEFLFIDGWIEHNQYYNNTGTDSYGVHGTWTQFMVGMDVQFDVGDDKIDGDPKNPAKGTSRRFGELGFGVGYGVGTGQQVDPPLDRTEVTHQGFLGQMHLDFGYRLTKSLSIGLHIPVQAGYILADSDQATTANCSSCWYTSIQAAALVTMRLNIALMR